MNPFRLGVLLLALAALACGNPHTCTDAEMESLCVARCRYLASPNACGSWCYCPEREHATRCSAPVPARDSTVGAAVVAGAAAGAVGAVVQRVLR